MMFTGRRFQEVIKIKKEYINLDQGIIQIPKEISKIREDQFITITEPVKFVLDMLEDQRHDHVGCLGFLPHDQNAAKRSRQAAARLLFMPSRCVSALLHLDSGRLL